MTAAVLLACSVFTGSVELSDNGTVSLFSTTTSSIIVKLMQLVEFSSHDAPDLNTTSSSFSGM